MVQRQKTAEKFLFTQMKLPEDNKTKSLKSRERGELKLKR